MPTITAAKVSDFDTQVRTSRLDQMATPTADVSMGSKKITNLAAPVNANDAARLTDVSSGVSYGTVSDLDGTNSAGSALTAARSDHKHALNAASVALSKLASGTSGQIIVCNSSGVPTYVTASSDISVAAGGAVDVKTISNARVSVSRTTTQSLTNNTDAYISWGTTPDTDPNTFFASGSPTKLTVPSGLGGLYLITAQVSFDSNATGARYAFINVNSSNFTVPRGTVSQAVSGFQTRIVVTAMVTLLVNDFVEVQVRQNSGGALNLTSANLAMLRIDA